MIITRTALVAALALPLAACAGTTPEAGTTPTSSAAPSAASSTEHPEAQPRIVAVTGDQAIVLSITEAGLSPVSEVPVSGAPRPVVGPDGRHVYLVDSEAGMTQVLDSGSYAQGHGDHFHYFTREPALRSDVIEGDTPIHVVGADGRVAIFNDGAGTVSVFDEIGLTSGGLQVETIDANGPHHGVSVPVHQGYLVTSSAEGGLPETVVQVDLGGAEIARYDNVCPGLHGEAIMGESVVFGCADSLAVIDPESQSASTIAYPARDGEQRVGSLFHGGQTLVGNWGADAFVVVDLEADSLAPVTIPGTVAGMAVTAEGEIVVLTTDGMLHVYAADGSAEGSVQVLEAFELPEGHGGVRPSLAVVGDLIVVSDVDHDALHVVDLHDMAVTSTFELGGTPSGIVATGIDPQGGEHDHEHEGEDHEDEDHDH
jgi:hypothetical protein